MARSKGRAFYIGNKKGHGAKPCLFYVLIIRDKDDSVAGAVFFTDEWKLVELDSKLKPSAVKF